MSSVVLLDKTRKIGNMLHYNSSTKVVFSDICSVMSEILESNVLVISKKGKILGIYNSKKIPVLSTLIKDKVGVFIDAALNERFLSVLSTKDNCNLLTLGFDFKGMSAYKGIVSPIEVAGERYGTLFIYKKNAEYDIDDIILSEYCDTVVGLEMMRAENDEQEEDERRSVSVNSAVEVLTSTERRAALCILEELNGNEGLIVTSKIADKVGITRSVLVNAIKKLESAGILSSQSAGVKGTHIKVINESVVEVLNRAKS